MSSRGLFKYVHLCFDLSALVFLHAFSLVLVGGFTECTNLNGKDARQYWAGDASVPAVFEKFDESVSIEEQLRDDKVCTGIHLLLQMSDVIFVGSAFWVTRWVT